MKFLVYIETKEGMPTGASLELISAASSVQAEADAVLIGANLEDAAAAAAKSGAASVIIINGPEAPTEDYITHALVQQAKADTYAAVLLSATPVGKVVTPRVATLLDTGSVTDVLSIAADGDALIFTRPAFGGTILEDRKVKGAIAVANIRGGSYEKPAETAAAPVAVSDITVSDDALRSKIVDLIAEAGEAVNLEDAQVIVSGGRGMGSKEDFALIEELADVLGGVVGATRPVIEEGWISRQHQVGQSGKIVAPQLYICAGVSGATQHVSGMSGSKYVVAINKDEDAPIFDVADVGIVGDAKKILPIFIEEVKKVIANK
jgi:electron transfer flavoprotein alpha subunit